MLAVVVVAFSSSLPYPLRTCLPAWLRVYSLLVTVHVPRPVILPRLDVGDELEWGALVVDVREELGDNMAWAVLDVGLLASSWLLVVLAASVPKSAAFQAVATRGGGRRWKVGMFWLHGHQDP